MPGERPLSVLLLGCPEDACQTRILCERLNAESGITALQFVHRSASESAKALSEALVKADATLVCIPGDIPPRPHRCDDDVFPSDICDVLDALEGISGHGGFVVPIKLGERNLLYYQYWSTLVVNLYERRGYGALLRTLKHRARDLGRLSDKDDALRYPLRVFFSYSHKDASLRDRLDQHLSVLKRQGLIHAWHDRQIDAGDPLADEISAQLESAEIVMLLVSSSFLASDYCWRKEMLRALQRHECGHARVIPIIARPCHWDHTPFANLLVLPQDGKPICSGKWATVDAALAQVACSVRSIVESVRDPPALITIHAWHFDEPNVGTSRLYPRLFEPDHIEFKRDFYPSDYMESHIDGAAVHCDTIFDQSGYHGRGGPTTHRDGSVAGGPIHNFDTPPRSRVGRRICMRAFQDRGYSQKRCSAGTCVAR